VAGGHGELMDRVYRTQRHVYDISRKYYLLGRDGLIADLAPPPGGAVLEIGCGTGRNLVAAAKAWPDARFFGVDISKAMLETARAAIRKAGLSDRVVVVAADACDFDAAELFGRSTFDRIFISYALSMIPDWQGALVAAARHVAPGGRLEVVDFGQQEGLPPLWRRALFGWLAQFHVAPRADLGPLMAGLAKETGGAGYCRSLYRGYALRCGLARS